MKASDCKCVKCGKGAVAFFPIFDIDQETPPRPYCRNCLMMARHEMLIALFDIDESTTPKQLHYPKKKK